MALTTQQIENIQIDHGLIYVNYGDTDERLIGPTRGGAQFVASKTIRDIEYDGRMGKTKGLQVVDEINAQLTFSLMDTSLENLALAMPHAEYDEVQKVISSGTGGIIPASKYLKNITMFAKCAGGKYKKITLFNAMNEGDFTLNTQPKSEGVVPFEVYAHWDPTAGTHPAAGELYKIEEVDAIA